MKQTIRILLSLSFGLGVVSAWGQSSQKSTPQPPPAAPLNSSSYVIGPDDMLAISVWKEPDLTGTLPVRADGMISLPLLNDIQAAGLTPMQLAAAITDKLKKYVADPRVNVTVTAMNSQRIYVMGEVLHPGTMTLLPGMTVLQALATSGFTPFANTKNIYILHNENGSQVKVPVNYKKLVKGQGGGAELTLRPGDTIVVP
jgi:polysaccharide export outer membrane protein